MIGVFYGCTTRADERLKRNLEEFFKKARVEYIPLGTEICCGAPLLLAGYDKEFLKQAEKVKEEVNKVSIVVTPCPHCFTMLSSEYKEHGIEINPEVLHITEYVKKLFDQGRIRFTSKIEKRVVYHDPCYIGRQGKGIYEEPRELLDKIVKERVDFELSRERNTCCGGGGLVRAYLPKLCVEVAKEKIEMQAKPLQVEIITSACPFCYQNLAEGSEGTETEVKDFLEIINQAME